MEKSYRIIEDEKVKILTSPNYNYIFKKGDGTFLRWGNKQQDDPEYCSFGPEIMDIEISTVCNKACSWCYKGNTSQGNYMPFEIFKKIFDKLPKTVTQIAFGIGDIDGNPDLWKIMAYCREKGVVPNITINGERMSSQDYKNLGKYCGAVAVSHYNDETCFSAIQSLAKVGIKQVNIHKILAEETYDDCMRLINQSLDNPALKDLNAIVFLWVKPKGPRNNLNQLSSMLKYGALVHYALEKQANIGFDSCSASSFVQGIQGREDANLLTTYVDSCESTCFSYYINTNGIGYPCSFSEGEEEFKGINVLEVKDFYKNVWYNKETVKFRHRLVNNKDCNGCRQCPIFDLTLQKV